MSVEPTTPWPRSVKATISLSPNELSDILRRTFNLPDHAKISFVVSQAGDRPGESYYALSSVNIETRMAMNIHGESMGIYAPGTK